MIRATTIAIGAVLASLGVLGLIPVFHDPWSADAPRLDVRNARGFTFGLIPNNLVITLVHLVFGLAGIFTALMRRWIILYLRVASIAFGAFALLGAMPPTSTLFGVMPLFGFNMWTHIGVAIVAAWLGWPLPADSAEEIDPQLAEPAFPAGLMSAVAIAGRPVHALLVPFPIAFVTGALVTDLSYWWTTLPWYNGYETFWPRASLWLVAAGLTTGCIAALVGLIDFLAVRRMSSIRTARVHALGGAAVLALAGCSLVLRLGDPATRILPWGICLSALSVVVLGFVVWQGTTLTYRYRIGVRPFGWAHSEPRPESVNLPELHDSDAA